MKLTYRGVQYLEKAPSISTPAKIVSGPNIIYRGNSPNGRINSRFPFVQYIKQLFNKSESKPVFDPITFWYQHQREFLDDCLLTENWRQLDRCWDLTLKNEINQALKSKQKVKFTYRGVTYYR